MSSIASMLTGLCWTEIHSDLNLNAHRGALRILLSALIRSFPASYGTPSQFIVLKLVTRVLNLYPVNVFNIDLSSCFPAKHLIPRYWLPEADWSRWWAQAAYFLWEENGHRGGCWPSGWWVEGELLNFSPSYCFSLLTVYAACTCTAKEKWHSADPFRLVRSH